MTVRRIALPYFEKIDLAQLDELGLSVNASAEDQAWGTSLGENIFASFTPAAGKTFYFMSANASFYAGNPAVSASPPHIFSNGSLKRVMKLRIQPSALQLIPYDSEDIMPFALIGDGTKTVQLSSTVTVVGSAAYVTFNFSGIVQ